MTAPCSNTDPAQSWDAEVQGVTPESASGSSPLGYTRQLKSLATRSLKPSRAPNERRSAFIALVSPKDPAVEAEAIDLGRRSSWGSVVEAFLRLGDRRYTLDSDGRMTSRNVLARRSLVARSGRTRSESRLPAFSGWVLQLREPDPTSRGG